MKRFLPIILALLIAPAISFAGDRWDRGGRSDRGYRYDRGERYNNNDHRDRSRSSFGFSFGFGNSGYRDNNYGRFSYGYNHGFFGDRVYRSRAPVVYRDTYVYTAPRYYDCPPPIAYCAPSPRVYYYDPCTTGSNYSGSVYYYRR